MKKVIKSEENRIKILVFLITMIVACCPLFTKYCITGHDSAYHLLRIEALKEGILAGKPFLKVNMLFFGGAGYASSMFYPDFMLYFPAFLRTLGVGINASYHLFVALCIVLVYISTYFSAKAICKDSFGGMAAAVILCLSNYFLDDVFVRCAVGEFTAFIFIPLVICGIYNTVYEDMNKPQYLAIGFMGLLLCHTLSFIICFVLAAGFLVIYIVKIVKNPKVILKLLATALISAGLTCTYWATMLEQFMKGKFYINLSQWSDPSLQAFQFAKGLGNVFPAIGISVAVFCIPLMFLNKPEKDNIYKYSVLLILASMALYVFSTDIFPWKRFGHYLSTIQFPWRLYAVASVCLAVASALVLSKTVSSVKLSKLIVFKDSETGTKTTTAMGKGLMFLVLLVMIVSSCSAISKRNMDYYDYSKDYYSYKPFTAEVIAGEWLPETVTDKDTLVEESESAVGSDGLNTEFVRHKNEVIVNIDRELEYVDVPLIFYEGYSAQTESKDNIIADNTGNNGFVRIYPADYRGKIRVFYKGTVIQHAAVGVSLGCLAIAMCMFIYSFYTNKRGEKQ